MAYFDYYYGFGEELEMFAPLYGAFASFASLLGLACYIIRSLSVYTIARRRGLDHPGLAWLPVGFEWLIGCLSDQYQYLVLDKHTSRRKVMLTLSVINLTSSLIVAIVAVMMVVRLTISAAMMTEAQIAKMILGPVMMVLVVALVLSVAAVILLVFRYICMYDVYRSCEPSNATLYLVLSILFQFIEPVFLLLCRKKDGGMPPRRERPAPAYEPREPWEVEE